MLRKNNVTKMAVAAVAVNIVDVFLLMSCLRLHSSVGLKSECEFGVSVVWKVIWNTSKLIKNCISLFVGFL